MTDSENAPVAIIAESDDETRFLIKSVLELQGFVVVEVGNEHDTCDLAFCYQPDLILIELRLPLMNGYSTIRRIRREPDLRKTPIIAISAREPRTTGRLALAAGCSALVQKPVDFDSLESVLERLVPCEKLSMISMLVH